MSPRYHILPTFLVATLFLACDSPAQTVSQQLEALRQEDERKISQHIQGSGLPILPQITIHSNPYTVPLRPFPASPIAPQYILDPRTGMFEQVR